MSASDWRSTARAALRPAVHRVRAAVGSRRGGATEGTEVRPTLPTLPTLPTKRAWPIAAGPNAFHTACNAPFVSMFFDQHGDVRACCQNYEVPLGNITRSSIREIWDGPAATGLRDALRNDDLSLGCQFCQWQADEGNSDTVFARTFDRIPVTTTQPEWPVQMEFSLSNACNLQCTMCDGEFSSAIRAHRELLPPLPAVYGDAFFEELAEFLPHLKTVNVLGGEPFFGREPLRVLEMLAEQGSDAFIAVTTNGTQWSPRIERILDRLPIVLVVSLDGHVPEVYEAIRVGARLDRVLENLDRFQAYAAERETNVALAHCLMRQNWRHFAGYLRFAEERGLEVYVNTVVRPEDHSLYRLPIDELAEVVAEMERQDHGEAAGLTTLRPTWEGQLRALQHRLELLQRGEAATPAGVDEQGERGRLEADENRRAERHRLLEEEARRVRLDTLSAACAPTIAGGEFAEWQPAELAVLAIGTDELVRCVASHDGTLFGIEAAGVVGREAATLPDVLGERFGQLTGLEVVTEDDVTHADVRFAGLAGEPEVEVRSIVKLARVGDDRDVESVAVVGWRARPRP